ncbi:hypothetical protein E2C01_026453 [Portunus trituberculatus]|uniref:Uncharacterized protein n=1 Tax=Portunus trituberculatus TaxID=210409 RepID=A0A5B7EFP0_PORTR|nr:hypothetical protein [Portunus trituberculatus]
MATVHELTSLGLYDAEDVYAERFKGQLVERVQGSQCVQYWSHVPSYRISGMQRPDVEHSLHKFDHQRI